VHFEHIPIIVDYRPEELQSLSDLDRLRLYQHRLWRLDLIAAVLRGAHVPLCVLLLLAEDLTPLLQLGLGAAVLARLLDHLLCHSYALAVHCVAHPEPQSSQQQAQLSGLIVRLQHLQDTAKAAVN